MTKSVHTRWTSLAAIAAATVLSPGTAFAQDADPLAVTAAPVETAEPVTTAEPVAVTPEPVESDPLTPAVEETPVAAPTTAPRSATRAASPAPARSAPASSTSVAAETPAPAPADAALPPVATTEALPPLAIEEPAPIARADTSNDDLLPIAAGAGVGLLALLGLGMAARRRKPRIERDVVAHEPRIARTVVDEPAPVTTTPSANPRPAFAWGNTPAAAATTAPMTGNRMERALQGPTPDNPFLSLKKRLKRAAFFDQRDRQVRAGIADRVSPMAGLPNRVADGLRPSRSAQLQPA